MGIFEAIRRAAAGDDPFYEPHSIDDYGHFLRTRDRLENVQHQVSRAFGAPHEQEGGASGVRSMRLDTGHQVITQIGPEGDWYAHLVPPGWPHTTSVHGTRTIGLGRNDEEVPQVMMHRLMHPRVQQYLRDTMPEQEQRLRDAWRRNNQ
jgi:hypothetical protein